MQPILLYQSSYLLCILKKQTFVYGKLFIDERLWRDFKEIEAITIIYKF